MKYVSSVFVAICVLAVDREIDVKDLISEIGSPLISCKMLLTLRSVYSSLVASLIKS